MGALPEEHGPPAERRRSWCASFGLRSAVAGKCGDKQKPLLRCRRGRNGGL